MSYRTNIEYSYDGSFDGLLCCVFVSVYQKEMPSKIYSPIDMQLSLIPPKEIETDDEKAKRVLMSIPKIHTQALNFVRKIFLTCLDDKEVYILKFLHMGYKLGSSVMYMTADETINILNKAVLHLEREAHLYLGFVRFSVFENAMIAVIEPKNFVLPLMVRHFCSRYPEENFMIYDTVHNSALIYENHKHRIIPVTDLIMPKADDEELKFRKLWQTFYNTIEVEGRHNPKCRMSCMPKRYWKQMTEFQQQNI